MDGPFRIVCISDSAFKREDSEGLAMRGAFICIVQNNWDHPGGQLHVIEHYSRKQKRVVRSTFAAELHALVDSIEYGKLLMYGMCELYYGPQNPEHLVQIEELARWPIPLEAVVDAYAVYSTAQKQDSKNPEEQTLVTLVMVIREMLRSHRLNKIWWVDTRDMLADGLNKGSIPREPLLALASTGTWDLQYECEGHQYQDQSSGLHGSHDWVPQSSRVHHPGDVSEHSPL